MDRDRGRRARGPLPGRQRARGGALRRRGDAPARRRGGPPLHRRRDLLSDERAVPRVLEDVFVRAGTPYKVVRRRAVLPAPEIKDVLAYLRLLVNPQDVISARRVINTPKRGIGDTTVAALEGFALTQELAFLEACRRVDEIPTLQARAKGAVAAFVQVIDMLQAAPRLRRRSAADDRSGGDRVGLPARARGRPHRGGRGADREHPGARRGRGRVRAARPDGDLVRLPRVRLARGRAGRVRRGVRQRHPHDAAQREGARVPRRLHHRAGGRRLPALPLDGRPGAARGGAPVDLRRGDPRARAPVPHACLEPLAVR